MRITDRELKQLYGGVVGPISLIAAYFSVILNRTITTDEAHDAIIRLTKENEHAATLAKSKD